MIQESFVYVLCRMLLSAKSGKQSIPPSSAAAGAAEAAGAAGAAEIKELSVRRYIVLW